MVGGGGGENDEHSTGMALEMGETKGQFDVMKEYIQQSICESGGLSFLNENHLHEACMVMIAMVTISSHLISSVTIRQ